MNPLRLIAILAVGICLMVYSVYMPARAAEPVESNAASDQSVLVYPPSPSDTWPQTDQRSQHAFRTLDVFAPNWRGEYSLQTLTYDTDFRNVPSPTTDGQEASISFARYDR